MRGIRAAVGAAVLVSLLGAAPGAEAARDGGYWLAAADGGVFAFGTAAFHGSMGGQALLAPIVDIAATPDGEGYWLAAADGGVFAFGTAAFHGSMGGQALVAPIVGITPTPDGGGYWLAAADGGVFAFGTAGFDGSLYQRGDGRDQPVVDIDAGGTDGYRLVDDAGCVFAFGTATELPGPCGTDVLAPVAAIAGTDSGEGFLVLGERGTTFPSGDASSTAGPASIIADLAGPVVDGDIAGDGVVLAAADGGVLAFAAPFLGSAAGLPLAAPVVAIAVR
jgi:hypothetical protein